MKQLYADAIQKSNYDLYVSLFSKHPDLNIDSVDSENRTSLWWAVKNQNIPLIKFLLKRNANPYISDTDNVTSLDLAKKLAKNFNFQNNEKNHYPEIVEILNTYCDSYQNTNNNNNSSNNNSSEVCVIEFDNSSSSFNSSSVFDTISTTDTARSRSNTLHREKKSSREALSTFLSNPRKTKLKLHIAIDDEPACTIRCVII